MSKLGRDSFLKMRKPIPPVGGEMKCKKTYVRKKYELKKLINEEIEEYKKLKEEGLIE